MESQPQLTLVTKTIQKETQKAIHKYLRAVRNALISTRKQKRVLLQRLQESITEKAKVGRIRNYGDIVAIFGTPEEISMSLLTETNTNYLKKQTSIKRAVLQGMLLVALCFGFFLLLSFADYCGIHYGIFT